MWERYLRRNFWLGIMLIALACSGSAGEETSSDGEGGSAGDPGSSADADADEGTPGDESVDEDADWMTIRARVQVDLYTESEDGTRQFLSWEEAVGLGGTHARHQGAGGERDA